MTITEVRGHGRQKGHKAVYRGREYDVSLLPKTMIEMAVPDELVDEVIAVIIKSARTGDVGDGRIWVLNIEEGYNIRSRKTRFGSVQISPHLSFSRSTWKYPRDVARISRRRFSARRTDTM